MISFNHVSKKYKEHYALDDLTVTINDGEFVFLIGPSGAGKTTVLRLILSDLIPSSGQVVVNGIEVNKIPRNKIHLLRRQVGMVFQDFKLLMDRTVFENVSIGLEIIGKKNTQIIKDVNDILNLVGLSDKKDLFPMQLSAGEMQRVSIARAIANGPKILLADEPTGNLDPDTSIDIMHILTEINRIGTTVVVATHNVSIVNSMAKRTIVIKDGVRISDESQGRYPVNLNKKEKKSHESK